MEYNQLMPFPTDEEHICDLEESLGANLPDCYRNFIKTDNGGSIELAADDWELHPIRDTTDRKRISRTANHVLVENKSYSEWTQQVGNTLSIAVNGAGDRLILQKEGNKYLPAVYLWSHETGEVSKIANSIENATRH
jgi:SMI1 / KNR4 family (SUKH-1)